MFPSSVDPKYSLAAFNSSSCLLTVKTMLAVVIIFIPILLAYQIWAHTVFKNTELDTIKKGRR